MTSKEKKSEYNKRYYERHKAEILAQRKASERKSLTADPEAHRKASLKYYYRKIASETPEERAARNAKRRERYNSDKSPSKLLVKQS